MTASILSAAGLKTGLHLSPHVQILNERFQIDGQMAPVSRLRTLYQAVRPAVEQVARTNPWGQPSYFEVLVAMAFTLFAEEGVDVAVIEVGLGGRLDATNVLFPRVVVLTNVGLDHTEILGETVEEIASDKVEIVKPGAIVVSGLVQESTRAILKAKSEQVGARVFQLGKDFRFERTGRRSVTVEYEGGSCEEVAPRLPGVFQFLNGSCAAAAASAFAADIACDSIRAGLETAFVPGRMEAMQEDPLVILDGAHNPDKVRHAVDAVADAYPDRRWKVVVSLKSDKNAHDVLPPLLSLGASFTFTEFRLADLWEPTPAHELAEVARGLRPGIECSVELDPLAAVAAAISDAREADAILVTGSLYLVGNVRDLWYPREDLLDELEVAWRGEPPIETKA